MKNKSNNCKTVAVKLMGNIAKKIAESAVHAAVFAYVSKKVTSLMTRSEDAAKEKIRVESSPSVNDSAKTDD